MMKINVVLCLVASLWLSFARAQPQGAPPMPTTPAPATSLPQSSAGSAKPVPSGAVAIPNGIKGPGFSTAEKLSAPDPVAPVTGLAATADPFDGLLEDFQYDPNGKRDPFAPFSPPKIGTQGMVGPVFPLQRFSIEQLKLQGIIWDVNNPKALVVDPSNRAHIIVKDDRIGQRNGYVAQIREDEVIIVESIDLNGRTIYQTRVLRMAVSVEKKQ